MFDISPTAPPAQMPRPVPIGAPDTVGHCLPFVQTRPAQNPAAAMAGEARPEVLGRFATLAEAMQDAIDHAEAAVSEGGMLILAIVDREDRLVLAGVARDGAVAWCHPVANAAEARTVVTEASQTRAQAARAVVWQESDLAERLHYRADLLEARLVDPLWRSFASRALQIAA